MWKVEFDQFETGRKSGGWDGFDAVVVQEQSLEFGEVG